MKYLLLLEALQSFLVTPLLGQPKGFGHISRPLDLTGRDAHLARMFLDPLVSFVQHASQIPLAFLQLLLQGHPHVLLNVTEPGLHRAIQCGGPNEGHTFPIGGVHG